MVKQLFPDFYLKISNIQPDNSSGVHVLLCHIIRQEGDTGPLADKRADQPRASHFQNRLYFQGAFCQTFIQEPPVTHAFFSQKKRLYEQLGNRQRGTPGQRGRPGGNKVHVHSFFPKDNIFCVINMTIER